MEDHLEGITVLLSNVWMTMNMRLHLLDICSLVKDTGSMRIWRKDYRGEMNIYGIWTERIRYLQRKEVTSGQRKTKKMKKEGKKVVEVVQSHQQPPSGMVQVSEDEMVIKKEEWDNMKKQLGELKKEVEKLKKAADNENEDNVVVPIEEWRDWKKGWRV